MEPINWFRHRDWDIDCPDYATISSSGTFSTNDAGSDIVCRISAGYSENQIARHISKSVSISTESIVDDGDAGTSAIGNWNPSSGLNYYGTQSVANREVGIGRYTFESSVSGPSEVYLWWTTTATRCVDVQVEIYDGATLLDDTIRTNQRQNSGQWNLLGTYTFSGTARVVIVSQGIGCSASADAVRFVQTTPAELDTIQIEGPVSVSDNANADFNVRAFYVGGSSRLVTADTWDTDCPAYGSISTDGLLATEDVLLDQPCQLSASYSEGGIIRNAHLDITILDNANAESIVDDGDAGTSAIGNWNPSSGLNYYGTQSVANREVGIGRYTFESSVSGPSEVYLWWTTTATRCVDVQVEIYDGATLLDDTIRTNQRQNSGQWNLLGTYTFSGTARVVIVSQGIGCSASADAVRFVQTTPAELDTIQIEGPVSVSDNANADFNVRAFYVGGSSRLVTADTWDTDCPAYGSISTDGLLATEDVLLDQPCQLSASYSEGGIIRNAQLDITILDNANAESIVDDGDAGTSAIGNWNPSSGLNYYGTQSVANREVGIGRYTFESSVSGPSEVYLWWTTTATRCVDVQVEIYDGATLLDDTIRTNQRQNSGQWNLLGTYTFSGTARVVIVSQGIGCSASADAVRFVQTTPAELDTIQIEGPVSVSDNANADFNVRAFYVGGSSRLVTADTWDTDCPAYGSISTDGLLATEDVLLDQPCQLSASYSEGGIIRNAHLDITILDNANAESIVDDGDAGTSAIGNWNPSSGLNYYGTQSVANREVGIGRYTFESSVSGPSEVYLWWTTTATRCVDVQVEIYDGATLLDDTIRTNQRQNSGQWNLLGTYTFSGTARVVIVSQGIGCSASADAVRFVH
jgi:hypothetical protein